MTGELAQIINLITNYNSGKIDNDLYDKNSTYQYCNSLNFIGFKKKFWRGYKEIEIANFAVSNKNTKGWEKTFNKAKDSLTSESPNLGYYKDLVPEDSLPKENLQLLVTASKSFVFGGMGSWNDIGWFDDKKITKAYNKLSEKLYRIMTESMIVAN